MLLPLSLQVLGGLLYGYLFFGRSNLRRFGQANDGRYWWWLSDSVKGQGLLLRRVLLIVPVMAGRWVGCPPQWWMGTMRSSVMTGPLWSASPLPAGFTWMGGDVATSVRISEVRRHHT